MTDTIGVELVAQDAQFIASTKAASAEMARLAQQEARLGKVASSSGLDQKKFAQTFGKIERDRIAAAGKAQKIKDAAEAKAARAIEAQQNKRASLDKKLERLLIGRKGYILGEATGLGTAGIAAIEFSAALAGAGVAALALLATIGVLATKAAEVKFEATGVLDTLTNGRGAEALKLVDGLADQLGIKFSEAREEFVKFRQAGLDNTQSAQLIKLRADAIAAGKGAAEADEAVSHVLALKGGAGTAAGLKEMAKEMRVVGDGSVSAQAKFESLNGALNRIDNDKVKILETIGEKIGPSVDKAAQAIARLADSLLNTKEGKAVIDGISQAIIGIADAARDAAPVVADFIKSGKAAQVGSYFGEVKDAFAEVISAAWEIPKAFYIVGGNINSAVNAVGGLIEDSFVDVGKTIYGALKAVVLGVKDIGGEIIDGLIDGLKSAGPKLLASVEGIASDIKTRFASLFKIHSPSLVFKGYGMNMGAGLDIGLQRSMPKGSEIAERSMPQRADFAPYEAARAVPPRAELSPRAASLFAQQPAPIFGDPASGGNTYEVNVTVQGGSSPDETARSVRREIDLWYRSIQQQQGLT